MKKWASEILIALIFIQLMIFRLGLVVSLIKAKTNFKRT